MLSSASTLGTVQAARIASLPERAEAAPAKVAILEGIRQRNAVFDTLFYDVSVIQDDEAVAIAPWLAVEGTILIVPPSQSGSLVLCASVEDFVAKGGGEVRSLAVAGVGSSALGSAAFARNVADATGGPVAAVVSGYGLADIAAEALGGFFWFGALNSTRHLFDGLDRLIERLRPVSLASLQSSDAQARRSDDTRTVLSLLSDPRLEFELVTGHSKGNLVVSEALYELCEVDRDRAKTIAASTRIVTVSARIAMPPLFRGVIDIMGAWDWFGALNSRPDIAAEYLVPHAWHHTNTEIPAHLPVATVLRQVLA